MFYDCFLYETISTNEKKNVLCSHRFREFHECQWFIGIDCFLSSAALFVHMICTHTHTHKCSLQIQFCFGSFHGSVFAFVFLHSSSLSRILQCAELLRYTETWSIYFNAYRFKEKPTSCRKLNGNESEKRVRFISLHSLPLASLRNSITHTVASALFTPNDRSRR